MVKQVVDKLDQRLQTQDQSPYYYKGPPLYNSRVLWASESKVYALYYMRGPTPIIERAAAPL